MADGVVVDLVAGELTKAADLGETRSRAALQEAVGVGSGDLDRALDELRATGRASEVEPDGWTGAVEEDPEVPEPEPEPDALAELGPSEPLRHEGFSLPGRPRTGRVVLDDAEGEKRVELTAGVASALSAEVLGQLVKAGIDEAQAAGVSFVFEVGS